MDVFIMKFIFVFLFLLLSCGKEQNKKISQTRSIQSIEASNFFYRQPAYCGNIKETIQSQEKPYYKILMIGDDQFNLLVDGRFKEGDLNIEVEFYYSKESNSDYYQVEKINNKTCFAKYKNKYIMCDEDMIEELLRDILDARKFTVTENKITLFSDSNPDCPDGYRENFTKE